MKFILSLMAFIIHLDFRVIKLEEIVFIEGQIIYYDVSIDGFTWIRWPGWRNQ